MSTLEQDTSLTQPENASSLAERPMDTPAPVSLPPEPADSSETDSLTTAREPKVISPQERLDRHRESVQEGLRKLEKQLDATPETSIDKRVGLRGKIRVFEDMLASIAEEQADLDRRTEVKAREEGRRVIEDAAKTRASLQKEGIEAAAMLRKGLMVVGALFSEWRELRDKERRAKDTVRSLAPQRMGECPDFSFATCVHPNFEQAIASALADCRKSFEDLERRGQPLPAVMQERIEREQAEMRRITR